MVLPARDCARVALLAVGLGAAHPKESFVKAAVFPASQLLKKANTQTCFPGLTSTTGSNGGLVGRVVHTDQRHFYSGYPEELRGIWCHSRSFRCIPAAYPSTFCLIIISTILNLSTALSE